MSSSHCRVCERLHRRPGASSGVYPPPENAVQRVWEDRIEGVFFGTALGDALGRRARGFSGEPLGDLDAGSTLETGTATQLTLFTAEGLVRMMLRAAIKGIGPTNVVIRYAYDRWLFTQGVFDRGAYPRWAKHNESWPNPEWPDGWLVHQHDLHARRSGVATTRAALERGHAVDVNERVPSPRLNASDGAGGLVRAAPAGCLLPPELAFEFGVYAAAQTHGGTTGYLSAGVLARVVAGLVSGATEVEAVAAATTEGRGWPGGSGLVELIEQRRVESVGTHAPRAALALIHGLEAARAKPEEPIAAIRLAVDRGGTAAAVVAGAVLGARLGAASLEERWRNAIDLRPVLAELSAASAVTHRALVRGRRVPGFDGALDGPDDRGRPSLADLLWDRYPGW